MLPKGTGLSDLNSGLIVILILVVSFVACGRAANNHAALGEWRMEYSSIFFYEDGIASLDGEKCTWKPIDRPTVLIEIPVDGETAMMTEFSIVKKEGREVGVMEFLGKDVEFKRQR